MCTNVHHYMKKWHTWPIFGIDFLEWDEKKNRFYATKGVKPISKIILLAIFFSAIMWNVLPNYDKTRILSFTTIIHLIECSIMEIFQLSFLVMQYKSQGKVVRLYTQINEVEKCLRNIKLHLMNRELFLPKLFYAILTIFTIFCPATSSYLYFTFDERKSVAIKLISGYFILYKLLTIYSVKVLIKDRFELINDYLKYVAQNKLGNFDCKYCFHRLHLTLKTSTNRKKDDHDCIYDMCLKHSLRCIRQILFKLHHCLDLWISDNGGILLGLASLVFLELLVDVMFWMQIIMGRHAEGSLLFANVFTSASVFFTALLLVHYTDTVKEKVIF